MGWDVIGGVALRGQYCSLLREAISNNTFISLDNRVRQNSTIWYDVTEAHKFGEVQGTLLLGALMKNYGMISVNHVMMNYNMHKNVCRINGQ